MLEDDLAVKIIGLYQDNPFSLFSINEIAKKLDKKYPFVHKKTKEMITKEYLNMTTVGRSNLCQLNIFNPITRYLLGFHEILKAKVIPKGTKEVIEAIIKEKNKENRIIFSLIEKKKYNKIYLIHNQKKDNLKFNLNNESNNSISDFYINYLSIEDFLDYIENNEDIFTNHIIVYGVEEYLNLILMHKNRLMTIYHPLIKVVK
jgi:hypothetical protein